MIDASNLVGVQETTIVQLPLDRITSKLSVRRLSASGIARLQESMRWAGFLDNFPLVVTPLEFGDYELIEGNHRYEAAKGLGIPSAPCIVKANLSAQERYRLAMQSNNAAETIVSSTLVTYAEFVWARAEEEYTQQQIATMLGWGRTQVANYVALKNICSEAWRMIVTTFEGVVTNNKEDVVTRDVTTVTITERLLRDILPLTPEQQTELVTDLATDPNFSKGKFKTLAKALPEQTGRRYPSPVPPGGPYRLHPGAAHASPGCSQPGCPLDDVRRRCVLSLVQWSCFLPAFLRLRVDELLVLRRFRRRDGYPLHAHAQGLLPDVLNFCGHVNQPFLLASASMSDSFIV